MGGPVGTVLGLAGAVFNGIGSAKATNAQAAQMYAEAGRVLAQGASTAQDLSNESALHNRQSRLLRIQGAYDAQRATEKGEQLTATQEAGFASNGFALTGSIADMVKTSAESAGLDIATMRYGADLGVKTEMIMRNVYAEKAVRTLKLAGAEAADMVAGADKVAGSATFGFISGLLPGVGTALKSSFA